MCVNQIIEPKSALKKKKVYCLKTTTNNKTTVLNTLNE